MQTMQQFAQAAYKVMDYQVDLVVLVVIQIVIHVGQAKIVAQIVIHPMEF
jgi:hypothetical protein